MNPRLLALGVIVGVALVALVLWPRGGVSAGSGATVRVERRVVASTVSALGAIQPQIGAEVRVGSRVSGRVRRLGANVGDRVERGQVIAEIETADLDAVVAERRAELALAEARLNGLDVQTPEELARARSEVTRREVSARVAEEDWDRTQELLRRQGVSRAQADAAQDRYQTARTELEAARRALNLLTAGSPEQRKEAVAEVERARAALDRARVERSFTVITAPITGVVASVATQEGETVAAGLNAPTFVTIVDLDRLQVNAYVDEVDIGRVAVGQGAVFTVDAYPAREFTGQVAAIYPTATVQDNVVKYIAAIAITPDTGAVLRPEMTASVRIEMERRELLAIPTRAVRRVEGSPVVYVRQGGRPERRAVRLGWRDGPWVEVVSGLSEGDEVLLDPPPEATP